MSNIQIEIPTLADLDTLVKWGHAAHELKVSDEDEWYSKETLNKFLKDPREDVFLVARVNGQLAGMCILNAIREWAYCSTLYVHTPFRSQGVGKLLLDEAHMRMKQNGINYIGLLVGDHNPKAIPFYKREGFEEGYKFVWLYKKK